jgi:uridine phosphorylase
VADIPLLEFDPDPRAILDPSRHEGKAPIPERAVGCFFHEVIAEMTAGLEPVFRIRIEHGPHPVWVLDRPEGPIAVFNPGVGAPLAASCLEIVLALGAKKVIACGGAGVLVPGFDVGHVVVPVAALRDEGTSYHYAPAGEHVAPSPAAVLAIEAELTAAGVPYERATTWTTDGLFRETRAKVARRREQGCLTVEMEAAALFAVARFRGATFGQLLYCGDDLSAGEWDHRYWDRHTSVRQRLFDLACGAAARL